MIFLHKFQGQVHDTTGVVMVIKGKIYGTTSYFYDIDIIID